MKHDITGSMLLLRSSQSGRSGLALPWLRMSEQLSSFPPPGEQGPLSREGLIDLLEEAISIAEAVDLTFSGGDNHRPRSGRSNSRHPPQRSPDGSSRRGASPGR